MDNKEVNEAAQKKEKEKRKAAEAEIDRRLTLFWTVVEPKLTDKLWPQMQSMILNSIVSQEVDNITREEADRLYVDAKRKFLSGVNIDVLALMGIPEVITLS